MEDDAESGDDVSAFEREDEEAEEYGHRTTPLLSRFSFSTRFRTSFPECVDTPQNGPDDCEPKFVDDREDDYARRPLGYQRINRQPRSSHLRFPTAKRNRFATWLQKEALDVRSRLKARLTAT